MPLSDYFDSMKGYTPVAAANPTMNMQPQVPNDQTQRSAYLRTTLPLPLQYSGDTVKQYNTPGQSSFRIAPLPPSGIPTINSAAVSAVAAAIKSGVIPIPSGGGSSTGTVELKVPGIFLPIDQTSDLPNAVLDITLAPEPNRTVFASAPSGAAVVDNGVGASALDLSISVSATSQNSNDLGLLFLTAEGFHGATAPTIPSGWSTVQSSGLSLVLSQDNVGVGLITADSTYTTNNANYKSMSAFLLTLGVNTATTPVIVTRASGGGAFGSLTTGGGVGIVGTGEALVAVVLGERSFQSTFAGYNTVTDNHGNDWALVNGTSAHTEYVPDTAFYGTSISVWVCTNPVVATDYSWTFSTVNGDVSGAVVYVFGITNLNPLAGTPYFRLLTQPDIPSINLAIDAGGSGDFQGVYGNLDTSHLDSGTNAGTSTVLFGTPSDGEWRQPSNTFDPINTLTSYTTQQGDEGKTITLTQVNTGGLVSVNLSNNFWGWISNQAYNNTHSPTSSIITINNLNNKDAYGNTVTSLKLSLGQTVYISSGAEGFIASAIGNGVNPAGLPLSLTMNSIGVSADKQLFVNGVTDGASVWTITVNGTPDGG